MSLSAPWGNRTTGGAITTTSVTLGIQANNPAAAVATKVVIENIGGNPLNVSFDRGANVVLQIPASERREIEGSMGDEVFVAASAATTDVQWWARGGS